MNNYYSQQENESQKDYELFQHYYLLGANRSINNLSVETLVSNRHLYRIAKKYNRKERIVKINEQEIIKAKPQFTEQKKTLLHKKLTNFMENMKKIQDVNENINAKADKYLAFDLNPETYFKRANKYLSIMVKLQKLEDCYEAGSEKLDLDKDSELENLVEEIRRFGDNARCH